jgi:hypothetical protein
VRVGEWDTQTTDEPFPHQDIRIKEVDYNFTIQSIKKCCLIVSFCFGKKDHYSRTTLHERSIQRCGPSHTGEEGDSRTKYRHYLSP